MGRNITDFRIVETTYKVEEHHGIKRPVVDELAHVIPISNGKELDCKFLYLRGMYNIDEFEYKLILNALNIMYPEHVKCKLIGSQYPIYELSTFKVDGKWHREKFRNNRRLPNNKIVNIELVGFSSTGRGIKNYKTLKIINGVNFYEDTHKSNIDELEYIEVIDRVYFIGSNKNSIYRIGNYENLEHINEDIFENIIATETNSKNHKITFNNVSMRCLGGVEFGLKVRELIFNENCSLGNINRYFLTSFENLKKIKIPKGTTILGKAPKNFIVKHGNKMYLELLDMRIELIDWKGRT